MSILKIKSKDFEMELSIDGDGISNVSSLTASSSTPDSQLAVALIALALNEYGDTSLHDEESGIITIVKYPTEWNTKSFGLNKGINFRK